MRVFPLTLRTRSGSQEFGAGSYPAEWNRESEIHVAPFKLMQNLVTSLSFRRMRATAAVCLCRSNRYMKRYGRGAKTSVWFP